LSGHPGGQRTGGRPRASARSSISRIPASRPGRSDHGTLPISRIRIPNAIGRHVAAGSTSPIRIAARYACGEL
jgi:hypothetical protein